MRIGLFVVSVNPIATRDYLAAVAIAAEERGIASLWVGEHVVLFDEYQSSYPYSADGRLALGGDIGLLEPFTALTVMASATDRVRLGTAVCLVPQRNPVYTAKQVSTLDWLSGGRVDFGVGIGWLREEFQALGVPFAERAARCREYLEVMQRLWRDPVSQFSGRFYELPPCRMNPKPVQEGGPPIYFGGETEPAMQRVAELGQGWHGFDHTPQTAAEHIKRLSERLEQAGRSLSDVDVTVCPYLRRVDPEDVLGYREAGVDQLVLLFGEPDIDSARRALDRIAKQYVEPAANL
jgi:probable F420-dependent oxidoreductase